MAYVHIGLGACHTPLRLYGLLRDPLVPPPPWLTFFQRPFPSANMALLHGPRPVLFDTGFGSDADETESLLRQAGTPPDHLALIVNSHYHCDHVGGNHAL